MHGITITFYGGASGVTGSKHLIEVDGKRILLDCGTFQGLPDVRARNRSFPFSPESIDNVVLSHAHIDHCGMLPLLVKRGFVGNIFSTAATKDVARHMMEDSAGIEEQDARYRKRHHVGAPDQREPLFVPEDIPETMSRFIDVPYARNDGSWFDIMDGIRVKLYDAGHILGSAIIVLEIDVAGGKERIAFSGDIGAVKMPLLYDPQVPKEEIGTLLLESTYGSREHAPLQEAIGKLADAINVVCERNGKIIAPAFSLGRTQEFVYVVHKLMSEERIPSFPIYVDSPLATDITEVYRRHSDLYDEETRQDFNGDDNRPLSFGDLTYTRDVRESKQLNTVKGPYMIVSASGMMTAGRVVHHLRHSISDPNTAIFITGFMAQGTTGRRILEGVKRVELYGDWFDVKAEIFLFNEFSAHADSSQLQAFADRVRGLKRVALVHGEPHQADDLKDIMKKAHPAWDVTRPKEGDSITI